MVRISTIIGFIAASSAALVSAGPSPYAPKHVPCPPDFQFVRKADSLSKGEADYVKGRHQKTDAALQDFLERASLKDFDAAKFLDDANSSINIGLAFSGGGDRAMLVGAGEIAALDNRTYGAAEWGLGGLLQASTYITGLSGGGWLLGSYIFNDFPTTDDILKPDSGIWKIDGPLTAPLEWAPPNLLKLLNRVNSDIQDKLDAGFPVTGNDLYGLILAVTYFPGEHNGINQTFSGLRDTRLYQEFDMPFPIIIGDGKKPGQLVIDLDSTILEMTPVEFGSWDPSLRSFADIKYLGTQALNGQTNNGTCVTGFDNAAFLLGVSSFVSEIGLESIASVLKGNTLECVSHILSLLSAGTGDLLSAEFKPNPFLGFNNDDNIFNNEEKLLVVDGGLDQQQIPIVPLLQPEREVDVLFAFDNGQDMPWGAPNGNSMVKTYMRQFSEFSSQGDHRGFPYVPTVEGFVLEGLTRKPTFFGCDAKNLTSLDSDRTPPLVVYIPNSFYTYPSDFQLGVKTDYSDFERIGMVQNGFEIASYGNLTIDSGYKSCIACALIKREQERRGEEPTEQCKQCFSDYCWSGKTIELLPEGLPIPFDLFPKHTSTLGVPVSATPTATA